MMASAAIEPNLRTSLFLSWHFSPPYLSRHARSPTRVATRQSGAGTAPRKAVAVAVVETHPVAVAHVAGPAGALALALPPNVPILAHAHWERARARARAPRLPGATALLRRAPLQRRGKLQGPRGRHPRLPRRRTGCGRPRAAPAAPAAPAARDGRERAVAAARAELAVVAEPGARDLARSAEVTREARARTRWQTRPARPAREIHGARAAARRDGDAERGAGDVEPRHLDAEEVAARLGDGVRHGVEPEVARAHVRGDMHRLDLVGVSRRVPAVRSPAVRARRGPAHRALHKRLEEGLEQLRALRERNAVNKMEVQPPPTHPVQTGRAPPRPVQIGRAPPLRTLQKRTQNECTMERWTR
jgi:hypothetical protein